MGDGRPRREPPSGFYDAMIAIAERRLTKDGLGELLRTWSKPAL